MCISIGGNLASIHSEDEQNFLRSVIVTVTGTNTRTWIGGYDAVTVRHTNNNIFCSSIFSNREGNQWRLVIKIFGGGTLDDGRYKTINTT